MTLYLEHDVDLYRFVTFVTRPLVRWPSFSIYRNLLLPIKKPEHFGTRTRTCWLNSYAIMRSSSGLFTLFFLYKFLEISNRSRVINYRWNKSCNRVNLSLHFCCGCAITLYKRSYRLKIYLCGSAAKQRYNSDISLHVSIVCASFFLFISRSSRKEVFLCAKPRVWMPQ